MGLIDFSLFFYILFNEFSPSVSLVPSSVLILARGDTIRAIMKRHLCGPGRKESWVSGLGMRGGYGFT